MSLNTLSEVNLRNENNIEARNCSNTSIEASETENTKSYKAITEETNCDDLPEGDKDCTPESDMSDTSDTENER